MAADASSKGQLNRGCDFVHPVADCTSAALNVTTISQKPHSAAQRIRFFNADTAIRTVTVTPELGSAMATFNVAVPIPAGGDYTTEFPISTIVSATGSAVVSAIVMWWVGSSTRINK